MMTMTFFKIFLLAFAPHIALQCPLTGGSAVFQARSLLALVGDNEYDDEDICGLQIEERNGGTAASSTHEDGFSLFPNPAKSEVTLTVPSNIGQGKAVIMDSFGRTLHEQALPESEARLRVNTVGMGTGVYLFTFYENGQVLFTEKLVIVK